MTRPQTENQKQATQRAKDAAMVRNQTIIERISAGETLQAVGTDYGVSRQRIEQIVKRAGIMVGYRRNPQVNAMVAAHESGESTAAIAIRLGIPYGRVRRSLMGRGVVIPPKPPHRKYLTTPHGTLYAYVYYKCRCDECTIAQRDERRREKVDRYARVGTLTPEQHGRVSTYTNWGCRCQPCRSATTNARAPYVKAWKLRNKERINARDRARRATKKAVDNAG